MEIAIKAAQLILSLSILVVLHELGHFLPAKLFRTHVEKFYLFFNPWFSLLKKKIGNTEYGIGWLPLGGYVKISGMIDESMDKEQMQKPPQPWEFRAKPAWQRLIIMVGGVTVNLLLAFFIYAMMLFSYGETYLPNNELQDGVWCVSDVTKEMGFQNGDQIVSIDGDSIERFSQISTKMLYGEEATVIRDGEIKQIDIPINLAGELSTSKRRRLFMPRMPFLVSKVPDTSINKDANLQKRDRIISIDGQQVKYFDEVESLLEKKANQKIDVGIVRNDDTLHKELVVSGKGKLELYPTILNFDQLQELGYYNTQTKYYNFFASFPAGFDKGIDKLSLYISQFKLIFNPETGAYKGLGGFGTIGSIFPSTWVWQAFWEITAFLSLVLAFMNILPIPALDGGHVMFTLYEMISGRKPSEKFLEYAQMIGMVLLLSLLIFANGNDIYRFFFN